MKINDLNEILIEKGIRQDSYCLTGGQPNEAYCIEKTDDEKWVVYHGERGIKSNSQCFKSEHDACNRLLSILLEDN